MDTKIANSLQDGDIDREIEKLHQMLEGTAVPTFAIDSACKLTHWNRACELLTGIGADKVIGTDEHYAIFYDHPRPVMADLIVKGVSRREMATLYSRTFRNSRLIKGGFEGEEFFPKIGREGKWLFFTAAPLVDSHGRIVGAIETIQDFTRRRVAEQHLLNSEDRYRQLFEAANDAIFLLKEGIAVDCNQKALEVFKSRRRDIVGQNPIVFSPDHQPEGDRSTDAIKKINQIILYNKPHVFEWRFRRKDGTRFDAEVSITRFEISNAPYAIAIVRDISVRKQLVGTLREREKQLDEKTRYLEKVNQALQASLAHREIEKRSVEENIFVNLKRHIFPYLKELGQCGIDMDAKAYLNIIETKLKELVSQYAHTIFSKCIDFTPTEIRIADLIRDGLDTKTIAGMLSLSPSSVQWHRKNIRQKLGLTNQKINLYTYLNSLPE